MEEKHEIILVFLERYRHLLSRAERRKLFHALTDGEIIFRPEDAVQLFRKVLAHWERATGQTVAVTFEGFHPAYFVAQASH